MIELGVILPDGSIELTNTNVKYRQAMSGDYRRIRQTPRQIMYLERNNLQWVNSSFISAIGVRDNDLVIRFHNSSQYIYYGYANHYDRMLAANSKGQYFNWNIRKTKRYKKIDNLPFPESELTPRPIEKLTDEMLFRALDFDYIKKISPELVGETIFIDNIIREGINFQHILIGDLDIFRPVISQ